MMEGLKIGRGGASNNRRTFDGTYLDSNSVENQWGEGGNFLTFPIGSNGPDALDTKWADFDVEKVNELLE